MLIGGEEMEREGNEREYEVEGEVLHGDGVPTGQLVVEVVYFLIKSQYVVCFSSFGNSQNETRGCSSL